MQRLPRVASAVFLALALCTDGRPLAAQAQQQGSGPRTLTLSTASEEARTATIEAATQFFNIHPTRAAELARKAMAADPSLGMSRAVWAWTNPPGLTAAQRAEELDRAVADGARATTGELLATATIRAITLNRPEANALLDALIALLPDDPVPPYLRGLRTTEPAQTVANMDAVTKKFPTFAPAWNILAYQRWATGDKDGAFTAAQAYMKLMPDHPNSHDSYGELLQFAGRLTEALPHYQKAVDLDPSFGGGPTGIAEVHMLVGHPAVAREAYTKAAETAPTPAGKVSARALGALMYVLDGKAKDAIGELGAVADDAEKQNLKLQAAGYHGWMALIEANFGDRRAVDAHLAKADALGGANTAPLHRVTALVYVATGQVDMARPAAAKYAEAMANGTLAQRRTVRELNAVIAAAEKDFDRVRSELAEAGPTPNIGRAMVADALARAGRKAEAQALKAEIMATGTATSFDVLARAKVQKM